MVTTGSSLFCFSKKSVFSDRSRMIQDALLSAFPLHQRLWVRHPVGWGSLWAGRAVASMRLGAFCPRPPHWTWAAPPLRHGTNLPASASAVNSRLSRAIWQQLSLTSPNPWECRKPHKTRPGEGPRPVVFAGVWHPARPPAVPLHRHSPSLAHDRLARGPGVTQENASWSLSAFVPKAAGHLGASCSWTWPGQSHTAKKPSLP